MDSRAKRFLANVRQLFSERSTFAAIAQNVGWLVFDKVFRMGIGLVVGVWVARYLGPERFGALSFALALTAFFTPLALFGLHGVVVRDLIQLPEQRARTLTASLFLQSSMGLVAYGTLLIVVFLLRPDAPESRLLVAVVGACLLFKGSETANYWFEAQVLSKYTVWIQNGVFIFIAALRVGLVLTSASVLAFAFATLTEAVLVSLLLIWALVRQGPNFTGLRACLPRMRSLARDAWPLVLSGVAVIIILSTDQIMLTLMKGEKAAGIYGAATRLSEVWYFIPIALTNSVFPVLLGIRGSSDALYLKRMELLLGGLTALALCLALPMTFLSTSLTVSLFGPAFADSGAVLAVHIWAAVFVFQGVAVGRWYLAENLALVSLQRSGLSALLNILFNYLLIPRYGPVGAAWAMIAAHFAGLLADLLQARTRPIFFMRLRAFNLFTTARGVVELLRGRPHESEV